MKLFISIVLSFVLAISVHATISEGTYIPPKKLTPQETLVKWAVYYNLIPEPLLVVSKCESSFNPQAINRNDPNGGSKGLMQFQQATFTTYATILQIPVPDIWNVEQQAQVSAYMFSQGLQSQWACSRLLK